MVGRLRAECSSSSDTSIFKFLYALWICIESKSFSESDLSFYLNDLPGLVLKASNISLKQFVQVDQYLQQTQSKKATQNVHSSR